MTYLAQPEIPPFTLKNQFSFSGGFDIIAADEDDASFSVDPDGVDYCDPPWCVAAAQPFEHTLSLPSALSTASKPGVRRRSSNIRSSPNIRHRPARSLGQFGTRRGVAPLHRLREIV